MNQPYARWLNTARAAAYLGLSVHTLHKWRAQERGPIYHRLGSRVQYDVAELEAFAADNAVRPGL